ncbi:benzaldehyde dehydrogenase [Acidocella aromatica]|uniref:Benzaldehyde dehydrogenase (NAD) n=1 Tax=Acidocella aromatica TaxID=1303579 RepID=A0A840VBG1_9PROT|nr:benzaldehyde dehydrogenase [Acidocella aromatica]MBB5373046.1 benzaldehyde dehydrogenase (NAD) [Acidocella aromatica]
MDQMTGIPPHAEPHWSGTLYDGTFSPASGGTLIVYEKATGAELAATGLATAEDVTRVTERAAAAQAAWAATPAAERAAILRDVAARLEANWDVAAAWIMRETGGVRPKADFEIFTVAAFFKEAAAMLDEPHYLEVQATGAAHSYAQRVPHGLVGIIAPFNFPLILSMRAVAPALATGNAVLLKPDPQTPISGGLIMAPLFEAAGLPPGLFNVLPGGADVGEALCREPRIRMIAFTGSTAAGRKVGALAGEHLKKTSLELGGKNALIVLPDADLELAVSAASYGAFLHQGQICMASGRILVHEAIADAFAASLAEHAARLPAGDPMSGQVALGPIINQRQAERVHRLVQESMAAGAKLLAGGTPDGLFYPATVLDGVTPGMAVFEEEVFGPVANIVRFSTEDEAVAMANAGQYGLSAGIITADIERAKAVGARIRTGMLHINDQTVVHEPHIPFGGVGSSGNGGRIGGPANWDEFTQWQWVTVKDTPPAYPF